MTTYYLVNAVVVQSRGQVMRLLPGALVDSAAVDTAALVAAGAELWPSGDANLIAAASRVAGLRRSQGADEVTCERVMRGAVAARVQVTDEGAIVTLQASVASNTAAIATLAAGGAWLAKNADYMVLDADGNFSWDVSGGSHVATLPTTPTLYKPHIFEVAAGSANHLTLNAGSANIVQNDGTLATTLVIASDAAATVFWDGTNWGRL